MIWQNYQLDNAVFKATDAVTLWRSEKGAVEIAQKTLVIRIKLDNEQKGFVFHGSSKLLLDTVIETDEGAIGKPVEREINGLFLMLGETEAIQRHFSLASKEDLAAMGYESEQGFVTKAENLFHQFFGRGTTCNLQSCGTDHGFIFAFPNTAGRLDTLVAKGSKLVYKALNRVFVSNRSEVIMKTPDEVIVAHNGKSFIIKR
jgi:hypothetical protein